MRYMYSIDQITKQSKTSVYFLAREARWRTMEDGEREERRSEILCNMSFTNFSIAIA